MGKLEYTGDGMKKSIIVVIISVIVLFAAAAALWFFNGGAGGAAARGVITFVEDGETVAVTGMDDIKGMDGGTFRAVIRSSGKKPEEVEYTGVLLGDMLAGAGINLEGKSLITINAEDGYSTEIAVSDLESTKIYIAYEMNGKAMKSKEQGGNGPYQLVIPSDPFSQRWIKFVCEVDVQ